MKCGCHPELRHRHRVHGQQEDEEWAPVAEFIDVERFIDDATDLPTPRAARCSKLQMALSLLRNYSTVAAPEGFALKDLLKKFDKQSGGALGGKLARRTTSDRKGDEWLMLFVAGMWFQDLWTYDFRRTEMCIIPYATQMGEISFCAYNTGVGWRQIVENMHKNATVAEWYKTHGKHAVYANPEEVGAAAQRRAGRAEDPEGRPARRLRPQPGRPPLRRPGHPDPPAASGPAPLPSAKGHLLRLFLQLGLPPTNRGINHFLRRPPNLYRWGSSLWSGPPGSRAYILGEVIPDAGPVGGTFQVFPRRRRIRELERIIIDNPSSGNLEELADLYLEDGKPAKARELYDRAITPRTASIDPHYRRGLAALALDDLQPAVGDFSRVVTEDPKHDFHRAAGLLAHVCARLGNTRTPRRGSSRRRRCPRRRSWRSTTPSSSSRRSAPPRRASGRSASWPRRRRCPGTSARRERPWFRRAKAVLKRVG